MTAIKKVSSNGKYTVNERNLWEGDWELINGIAYAMSPTPTIKHQEIASKLHGELYIYLKDKPCKVFEYLDVELSQEEIVIPDIIVVCDEKKMADGKNIKGAPDFVIEIISPSTSKRDKIFKRDLYKRYGVKEYWIVDPFGLEIIVYDWVENTQLQYFYDETEIENFIPVAIFGNGLKLDLKYIFGV